MTSQTEFASQLDAHMKRAAIGDARLAKQVNSITENPYFIHRSTLRNWRTGTSQKVNNWRQLATVAVALGLNEEEATRLLESAGCPSIQSLTATAPDDDQSLLAYWQQPSLPASGKGVELGDSSNKLHQNIPASDSTPPQDAGENNSRMWKFLGAGVLAIASVAVVAGVMSPAHFQFLPGMGSSKQGNLLANSHFENGASGWTSYVNAKADAEFKIIDQVMRLEIRQKAKKSWHIALNQQNLEVTAGENYTARFRVRGDGATSMQVDITRVKNPKTSLTFGSANEQTVQITDEWVTQIIEYEVVETSTMKDGGARLFFKFGYSEKGWVEIDDIELHRRTESHMNSDEKNSGDNKTN